ncbi:hypothetical protein FOMPIDRAFT_91692 [Fomitopsis schrenkii]|uniref:Uncharacterized protein n=1 Tax=Fomitopsis schrenkii TaxID=2126942 RepID=S8FJW7_FOMSC|nr:hypothetical protein FOMPIDRAFT_91692 [Fomitopsis schrenkii]
MIHSHHSPSTSQTPATHPSVASSGTLSASASSVNLASLGNHPQPMTTPEQFCGFLGGGIKPLSSPHGLPSYDDTRPFKTWRVAHTANANNTTQNARRNVPQEPPPGTAPLESYPHWFHRQYLHYQTRCRRTCWEESLAFVLPKSVANRVNSRVARPERSTYSIAPSTTSAHSGGMFVHSRSHASRNMHVLFHIAMKLFISLSSMFLQTLPRLSHSNHHARGLAIHSHHSPSALQTPPSHPSGSEQRHAERERELSQPHEPRTPPAADVDAGAAAPHVHRGAGLRHGKPGVPRLQHHAAVKPARPAQLRRHGA